MKKLNSDDRAIAEKIAGAFSLAADGEVSGQTGAEVKLTPNEERWISGRLWAEFRGASAVRVPVIGRNPWWDLPLNPKRKPSASVAVKCGRCDGAGAIASFSIRYSGKCFACDGSGVRFISKARAALAKAGQP